jgi:N-acyl-D-amino-acid deacylase
VTVAAKPARRRLMTGACGLVMLTGFPCAASADRAPTYDLIVRNGMIYDGSGTAPVSGDVAVRNGRIVGIGPRLPGEAQIVIDAGGRAVAPGFINAFSHATYSLVTDPLAQADIRQGVTLEILGEGDSPGPRTERMAERHKSGRARRIPFNWRSLGEYLEQVERRGTAVNFAAWVGATTVRQNVLGDGDVRPSPAELGRMRMLVRDAMQEGALGVSSALIYVPGAFATTDELVALATEVGRCGGMYVSHMRSEGDHFIEALDELIDISRRSGAPAEVFHIKVGAPANWPKMAVALDRIRAARAAGLRVTANMYPYTASSTGLTASLPPWVQEGGEAAMRKRLRDPTLRARVLADMRDPAPAWENVMLGAGGAKGVVFTNFRNPSLQQYRGKTLAEVAALLGVDAEEAALRLIEAEEGKLYAFYFTMSEDNLRRQIQQPYVSFGSDASAQTITPAAMRESQHPRGFGTFARVFARYVREEKLLSVEEAVRRLTSLPAANYGLIDRGLLKPGYHADIVVFDPEKMQDHATYDQPFRYATGVSDVVVNGIPVLAGGEPTGARPGKAVRGRGWRDHPGGGCRASSDAWR